MEVDLLMLLFLYFPSATAIEMLFTVVTFIGGVVSHLQSSESGGGRGVGEGISMWWWL